jgi:outer membrane protein TolC
VAAALLVAFAGVAAEPSSPAEPGVPGGSVEELLAIAQRMNPEVAAAALDSEAALARVDAAGRLPDPSFATEFRDISRQRDSGLPEELARVEYKIQQEFPLWGKRQLEKDVARAEAGAARQERRAAELDVAARIKTVFASRYAAFEGWRLTTALHGTFANLAEITQSRYAQGLGEQEDAIRAEVEKTRLRTELARFEAVQRQTAVQINALLDRPPAAPLAPPAALRPVPIEALTLDDLLERARAGNPAVGAAQSRITAAEGDETLVRRSWYPDVMLGVTFQQFIDQSGRSPGYEAMIGTTIPLQWGLRQAREREAKANVAAARRRLDAASARVHGDLGEAYHALQGLRRVGSLLRDTQLPQTLLAFESALRGYEQGRSGFIGVLDGERQVFATMLQLLSVQVEQQERLADIERLIGGEL